MVRDAETDEHKTGHQQRREEDGSRDVFGFSLDKQVYFQVLLGERTTTLLDYVQLRIMANDLQSDVLHLVFKGDASASPGL